MKRMGGKLSQQLVVRRQRPDPLNTRGVNWPKSMKVCYFDLLDQMGLKAAYRKLSVASFDPCIAVKQDADEPSTRVIGVPQIEHQNWRIDVIGQLFEVLS